MVFIPSTFFGSAHIKDDAVALKDVSQAIEKTYNYEFSTAQTYINKLKVKYKNHPVTYVLEAQILNFKLPTSSNLSRDEELYIGKLDKALSLASAMLEENKEDAEAKYFSLSAYGFKTLFYSDRGQRMKAANIAKKAFKYMKDGFTLQNKYNEFYFTSGLYHYYAIQYPQTHPIVKPVMTFFPNGNKAKGLYELQKSSNEATFSKVEATQYLGHIYLKYEKQPAKAFTYFDKLHKKYPKNIYFTARYTECLMAMKKYSLAKAGINTLLVSKSKDYQNIGKVYDAWYYEMYKKDIATAKTKYIKAIVAISTPNQYTYDAKYWGHLGMARILKKQGHKDDAKKEAKETSNDGENELAISQAEAFLKAL